jgi:hypothetical protein
MATGPNASVVEAKLSGKLGVIGTSGPINADGGGPQRARQAPSIGFGRGGAICEYDEIMQILPGSSDDPQPYKCIGRGWQYIQQGQASFQN